MEEEFIDQELELAAKSALIHIADSTDSLKALYIQPDRVLFLAENLDIILKVYMADKPLQRDYEIAQKAASIGLPIPKILDFKAGRPAVFVMKQVIGCPLSSLNPIAAKEAGRHLRRFHAIGAHPPFSGGQQHWNAFIS